MREEVWRRRKWLRLRLAAEPELDRGGRRGGAQRCRRRRQARPRRGEGERQHERREDQAMAPMHGLDLGLHDGLAVTGASRRDRARPRRRWRARRGRRRAGRPPSPAPARSARVALPAPPKVAPQQQRRRQRGREAASASATAARDRGAAASIPCGAASPPRESASEAAPALAPRVSAPRSTGRGERVLGEARREDDNGERREDETGASTAASAGFAQAARAGSQTRCRRRAPAQRRSDWRGDPRRACRRRRIATDLHADDEAAPMTAATICATSRVRRGPIMRNSATVSPTASALTAAANGEQPRRRRRASARRRG